MKKITLLAILVFFLALGCSSEQVKQPSKCDPGSPEIASLIQWSAENYGVQITSTEMLLCDIARDRGYHLEATGDLLMAVDMGAIRANAITKQQVLIVFAAVREALLAAARGTATLNAGDLAGLVEKYAEPYPELQIAMRYTNILKYPEYIDKIPTTLDLMDLVQYYDRKIGLIKKI